MFLHLLVQKVNNHVSQGVRAPISHFPMFVATR